MSTRGRPPTPIPVKRKLGNPGKRPIGIEPDVRKLRPEFQTWLDGEALGFLERHLPELERVGLLTVVDGPALSLMADRYAEVLAWRELVRDTGIARAVTLGYVNAMRRAEDSFRRWATEYGFTALSRTRLATEDGGGRGAEDEGDLDAGSA